MWGGSEVAGAAVVCISFLDAHVVGPNPRRRKRHTPLRAAPPTPGLPLILFEDLRKSTSTRKLGFLPAKGAKKQRIATWRYRSHEQLQQQQKPNKT
mmetsp:Transcript_1915/g.3949  ORF Transcript_1915/g.3949 Transcript_1915/m.3949 type:complete len:96 (-) Transcript_1915:301-588(-)